MNDEDDYGTPANFQENCWFFGTIGLISVGWAVLIYCWFFQ